MYVYGKVTSFRRSGLRNPNPPPALTMSHTPTENYCVEGGSEESGGREYVWCLSISLRQLKIDGWVFGRDCDSKTNGRNHESLHRIDCVFTLSQLPASMCWRTWSNNSLSNVGSVRGESTVVKSLSRCLWINSISKYCFVIFVCGVDLFFFALFFLLNIFLFTLAHAFDWFSFTHPCAAFSGIRR